MNEPTTLPTVPSETANPKLWHSAFIAVTCLVLYLSGNGRISLWDRDEPWYAQTAREMVNRGDYVVPLFNGQPRYRKPVLIYWLMASAYSLFGDNEFSARLFSGIAGAVTCVLTYRLGCRMSGRTVGLCAGLILAVAPFMVIESKLATTDAVLTAFLTAAMSCVWELQRTGNSRRWALAFWVCVAALILTKGPFGLAFIALALLIWLPLSRRWDILWRMNWLPGIALALAICLPWGLAIYSATDGEFYRVAVGEQAIGHSFSAMNEHRGFPGFYLLLALGGLFPWTLTLSLAFAGIRRWARDVGPGGFLIAWMFGPLIMLEIMRTKLPQYYLPAFPAWALLIARGLVTARETFGSLRQTAAGQWRVLAIAATGIIGAIGIGWVAAYRLPADLQPPTVAVAGVLGCGTLLATLLLSRMKDQLGWTALVGTWWSVAFVTSVSLLPRLESYRMARTAAESLRAAANGAPVVLVGYREPSLVFYLGHPVPTFSGPKELIEYLQSSGPVHTLLRDAEMTKLEQSGIRVEPRERIEPRSIRGVGSQSVVLARVSLASDSAAMARGAMPQDMSEPPSRR